VKSIKVVLVVGMLLSVAGLAKAQDEQLGVTLDVTYVSSYIWRGFDKYGPGSHSAIQPSIDVDLYGTGFGVKTWMSRANSSGYENQEEWNYTVYYSSSLFEDVSYATDYTISYIYYDYPDQPDNVADMQEINVAFSWPKICPAGIVPSYSIINMWPSEGGGASNNNGGWIHVFGLGYDLALPGILSDTDQQLVSLSCGLVYNDGTGGGSVDHDWSHMVFGASTGFEVADNLTFTPGIYYQASMDDSVNTEDETWVSLSMTYKF